MEKQNQTAIFDADRWKESILRKVKRLETIASFLSLVLVFLFALLFLLSYSLLSNRSDLRNLQHTVSSLSEAQEISTHKSAQCQTKISNLMERIDSFDKELLEYDRLNAEALTNDSVKLFQSQTTQNQQYGLEPLEQTNRNAVKNGNFFSHSYLSKEHDAFNVIKDSSRNLQYDTAPGNVSICDTLKPFLSPLDAADSFTYNEEIEKKLAILHGVSTLESLTDRNSPQYKAACWLLWDDTFQIKSDNPTLVERYALATYYYSQNEKSSKLPSNLCDLGAVECNVEGHMTSLNLSDFGLKGFIPTEFFNMFKLERLNLKRNDITGTLPRELARMTNLRELYLSENSLKGMIPTEIGELTKLEVVQMDSNQLSGKIPTEIGLLSRIVHLGLNINRFTGAIPPELFDCTELITVNLEDNQLSGHIPTNFEHMINLKTVTIAINMISGNLPSEIGLAHSLEELWFRDNKLSGTVPRVLGSLGNLSRIILEKNQFTGNLDGVFDNFTFLWGLNIGSNKFTGKIPEATWEIDFELGAVFEGNELTGTVPDDFCSKVKFLKLDNSAWLQEPKIDCKCCNVKNCFAWDIDLASERPMCPVSNRYNLSFFETYIIEDLQTNQKLEDLIGMGSSGTKPICVSPTGCYSIENKTNMILNNGGETEQFFLQYSNESQALENQSECDAVTVCGQVFDKDHPKRKGLNHLTQLVVPNFKMAENTPEGEALCFMLIHDELYEEFEVCDGTLLQRYVLGLFFNTQKISHTGLITKHTCDWDGISCDDDQKFVVGINLSGQKLQGTLNSELGLLTKLREINLSDNELKGRLTPVTFSALPNLEIFDIGNNDMSGEIPKNIFVLPKLKKLDMSQNLFHGALPADFNYSSTLEIFDLGNNLLQGHLTHGLFSCDKLNYVDLSQNHFSDEISVKFGKLKGLKILRLYKNNFRGLIPIEIFNLPHMEELMLQSNILTGVIPTQVGNLKNLKKLVLSHNEFRGKIPTEIGRLEQLQLLHLHHTKLTGTAPPRTKNMMGDNSYITDCGHPSFSLQSPVFCPECTICCNSVKTCQKNLTQPISLWIVTFVIFAIIVPVVLGIFILVTSWLKRKKFISLPYVKRSSLSIYNESSIYSLIFSSDPWALVIYFAVAIIQALLFLSFLKQSDLSSEATDWEYTIRCPDNKLECINSLFITQYGWILFSVVVFLFMGSDIVDSFFQLERAVTTHDPRFFISGVIRVVLSALAVYTSYEYNLALATTNTELISNTVILLFINDLDERCLLILDSAVPSWVSKRYAEIHTRLASASHQEYNEGENQEESPYNHRLDSLRFVDTTAFKSKANITSRI